MRINKKIIKYNFSSRIGSDIKYIVIHDTGNINRGANADAHFRYFNSGNKSASAHYLVDNETIIQIVEDYNAAWHCGDGKGRYGITNSNSIGIEICINSDGDYLLAVFNTIFLVRYLMEKYQIPVERVVRHYDASGKTCPRTLSGNSWARWKGFLNSIK